MVARADVRRGVNPTRKQIVLAAQVRLVDPRLNGFARWHRDLELERTPRFLVLHDRATGQPRAVRDIAHLQRHQIASPQLAVDAKVDQSQLAHAMLLLQSHTQGPDVLRLERGLLPDQLALVPRLSMMRAIRRGCVHGGLRHEKAARLHRSCAPPERAAHAQPGCKRISVSG
jgi:hypothetical protein